jgi:hypothetical protein
MLTPADMEPVLENVDRRLTAIEQKLPTLATTEDLAAHARTASEQLAAHARATGEQLAAHVRATEERLDAHALATTRRFDALAGQVEDVKQYAKVLNEHTNENVRLLAESLDHLRVRVDDLPTRREFVALSDRVDGIDLAVRGIARDLSAVGRSVVTLTTRLEDKGVI